ncbi:MAG: carboxypeptidase-like regulatory domain-containing protein [Flavobacteriales bacterium]|nr:carboxypeptidase-like regulatory domain-containing protein [Flavobacteriales bacterium]
MEKLKKGPVLSVLVSVLFITNVYSQSFQDSTGIENSQGKAHNEILKTLILDAKNQTPLPYANVYLLDKKKGLISNEEGYFSINTSKYRGTDTLRISYMGYQTKEITIKELKTFPIISLNEEGLMLNDITLFGNTPDPKLIVKKVLENKHQNYQPTTSKKQLFIRQKEVTHLNQLNLDFKKSSFVHLNNELLNSIKKM